MQTLISPIWGCGCTSKLRCRAYLILFILFYCFCPLHRLILLQHHGALGVHVQTLISPIWGCGCTSKLRRLACIFIDSVFLSFLIVCFISFFLYNIVILNNCVWKINFIKSKSNIFLLFSQASLGAWQLLYCILLSTAVAVA